ncbi:hypothetical protein BT69DRAFT_503291 [Atractiella rhizophila]|nr:hypothetical protein BT69DRAFT_503291 [Atractiella rhizophila]
MVEIIKQLPRLEECDVDVVSPRKSNKWQYVRPILEALKKKKLTALGLHAPDEEDDTFPDYMLDEGWRELRGSDDQKLIQMFGLTPDLGLDGVSESEMTEWLEHWKAEMKHLFISVVEHDSSSERRNQLMELIWFGMPKLYDMTLVGVVDSWLVELPNRLKSINTPQLESRLTTLELHACPGVGMKGLDTLLSLTKELRILRLVGVPDEEHLGEKENGAGKPYRLKHLWMFDWDNALGLVWAKRFIGSPIEVLLLGEMGTEEDAHELESFLFREPDEPFPTLKKITLKETHELDEAHVDSLELRCFARNLVFEKEYESDNEEEEGEDDSDEEDLINAAAQAQMQALQFGVEV